MRCATGPLEPEGRVGDDVRALFVDRVARSLVAPQVDERAFVPETVDPVRATVAVPTLAVIRPLDEREPIDMREHAATTIRGARRVTIRGTAHPPNPERPDLFVPELRRLIEALD